MTSTVQAHVDASKSFVVVYTNFLLWANHRRRHILCAFEGLDHHYYDSRVRQMLGDSPTAFYHMGGKSNVLELLSLVDAPAMRVLSIAFFVDRDYAAPSVFDDRLYVTPHYSIENHYITPGAIRRTLITGFDLREQQSISNVVSENTEITRLFNFCNKVFTDYNSQLGIFLNAALWAAYDNSRLNGKTKHGINTKHFDENIFANTFGIDENGFSVKADTSYDSILRILNTTSDVVPKTKFAEGLRYFSSRDLLSAGRGKWLFIVFMNLIQNLRLDSVKTKPKIFQSKQPCLLATRSQIPLSDFSSFADSPVGLSHFLHSIKRRFSIR